MKKLTRCQLLAAAISVALCIQANADNLYVSGSGGDIQSAINQAQADDTTAIYVSDAFGDDAQDGTSWASAKKSIQAGINAQSITGGSVIVSNGVYSSENFPIIARITRSRSRVSMARKSRLSMLKALPPVSRSMQNRVHWLALPSLAAAATVHLTPFTWAESTALHAKFLSRGVLSPTPITMANGVWSGTVEISAVGTFRIQATNSTDGAFALSNPFDITEDGRPRDSDGDGVSDADELVAGTNADDPTDYFRIITTTQTATGLKIVWVSQDEQHYSLYWTPDLSQPFELHTANIQTKGSFVIPLDADAEPQGFYKLEVEWTPTE